MLRDGCHESYDVVLRRRAGSDCGSGTCSTVAAWALELQTKAIRSFAKISQSRALSWLKAPTSAFTFKTIKTMLNRH